MKAKEQIIEELNRLNRTKLLDLFNLIATFKNDTEKREKTEKFMPSSTAYLKAREALKNCKGSLADDIISDREERI